MKDEYIIINKTAIQRRIEELEKQMQKHLNIASKTGDYDSQFEDKIEELKEILSQSTPLIPLIEDAFDEGFNSEEEVYKGNPTGRIIGKKEYISHLKFDI